jgi:hypothetical protein
MRVAWREEGSTRWPSHHPAAHCHRSPAGCAGMAVASLKPVKAGSCRRCGRAVWARMGRAARMGANVKQDIVGSCDVNNARSRRQQCG